MMFFQNALKKTAIIAAIIALFSFGATAFAQTEKCKSKDGTVVVCLQDPLKIGTGGISELATRINKGIFGVIGIVALLMFIYAGVLLVTAAGNKDKIATARGTMVWAAIGLATIFSSYAILNFVLTVLSSGSGK